MGNIEEITKKGIEFCDNIKNNCTICPLCKRVCISAPYGLFLVPDRKMDFDKFIQDLCFMLKEIDTLQEWRIGKDDVLDWSITRDHGHKFDNDHQ